MRRKESAVRTAVLIVIILVTGWIFWPVSYEEIDLSPPETRQTEAVPEPAVTEIDDPTQGEPERIALPPQEPDLETREARSETASLGPDEGLLKILVLMKTSSKPVKGAHILLYPDTRTEEERDCFFRSMEAQKWGRCEVHGVRTVFLSNGDRARTDESGRTSVRLPAGIPIHLTVLGKEYTELALKVKALLPRERREMVAEVSPLLFFGKVVEDSPELFPVSGAKVIPDQSDIGPATTDSAGLFELQVGSRGSTHVSILASGYGPVLVKLTTGHETKEKALLIKLDRSASLSGRVQAMGGPAAGALVTVSAGSSAISRGDEPVVIGKDPALHAKTDPAGFYRLEGLPPHAELTVKVIPEGGVPVLMPKPLFLEPGEERRADFTLPRLATLLGRVLDQHSRPVVGIPVAAVVPRLPEAMLKGLPEDRPIFIREFYDEKIGETVTDLDGAFVFSGMAPGRVLVGVLPEPGNKYIFLEDRQSEDMIHDMYGVSSTGLVVRIPEGVAEKEIIVRVHRGLYIRGRVLDHGGKPGSRGIVQALSYDYTGLLHAVCDGEGAFAFGPLLPGRYRLQVLGFSVDPPRADSPSVEAKAGDDNVMMYLTIGGVLSGRVACDDPDVEIRSMTVFANNRETGVGLGCPVGSNGAFRIYGLMPGIYDLSARLGESRAGILLGARVVAGVETKNLLITLEPAATLVVVVKGAKDFCICMIQYQGCTIERDPVEPDRPLTFTVPPGRHRVALGAIKGEEKEIVEIAAKEVKVNAGEKKEIVFELIK